jgi:branched-chain amino acid transport system substrate-binding protein
LICIQAKQLGVTVPIFGGDGWESETSSRSARTRRRQLFLHPLLGGFTPHEAADFVAAYRKKFNGKTPDAMAMLGYDSVMILADAIQKTGSAEPAKIRDALAATKDFDGVSGKITIDAKRDASKRHGHPPVKTGNSSWWTPSILDSTALPRAWIGSCSNSSTVWRWASSTP